MRRIIEEEILGMEWDGSRNWSDKRRAKRRNRNRIDDLEEKVDHLCEKVDVDIDDRLDRLEINMRWTMGLLMGQVLVVMGFVFTRFLEGV